MKPLYGGDPCHRLYVVPSMVPHYRRGSMLEALPCMMTHGNGAPCMGRPLLTDTGKNITFGKMFFQISNF